MSRYEDTIAAISTAASPAGIAVIRVSGPDAVSAVDQIFVSPVRKKLSGQKGNTIHYGWIRKPPEHISADAADEDRTDDKGSIVDEVLIMLMRAPHTFTREDVVEIDCHGGVFAAQKVLDTVLQTGVRPAEPGEFTKRAFLNGRIDLSQAEAVMDIISSRNQYALQSSVRQLSGALSGRIHEIRKKLLHETAFIEAALDDPEHIDIGEHLSELNSIVSEQKLLISDLIRSADSGKMIREGIKTVIVGRPNAGKSSLLNALTGEETAIVTDIAGTTRDVLEDQVTFGGIALRLLDTAGIRQSDDKIEQIGISRARSHAEDADLILYVVDSSECLDENDQDIFKMIRGKKAIVLLNKSDLKMIVTKEEISSYTDCTILEISAKHREGFTELEKCIREMFFSGQISQNDEIYITNARHTRALQDAYESLTLVQESIQNGMPEDFFSIDLMAACDALGRIIGADVSEDLINEIFSGFCLGK